MTWPWMLGLDEVHCCLRGWVEAASPVSQLPSSNQKVSGPGQIWGRNVGKLSERQAKHRPAGERAPAERRPDGERPAEKTGWIGGFFETRWHCWHCWHCWHRLHRPHCLRRLHGLHRPHCFRRLHGLHGLGRIACVGCTDHIACVGCIAVQAPQRSVWGGRHSSVRPRATTLRTSITTTTRPQFPGLTPVP